MQTIDQKQSEQGFSIDKFKVAQTLDRTTKVTERIKKHRKSIILLKKFITDVMRWQKERPPLFVTDQNLNLLILFFLGEIDEVSEHRSKEGLPGYDFKSEVGETIDAGFFLASFSALLESMHKTVDLDLAVAKANGQANGSHSLELLKEVGGNITEKSLHKDMQYLWTLWVSYLIHMKYPVSPTEVLNTYTFPKNNGNYVEELLRGNPIFERTFQRKMNTDEEIAYFSHYRKAVRLIRDFIQLYIDPGVEHSGLKPEHYRPYKLFIYSFMKFPSVGLAPEQALQMLETQLYTDFKVLRTKDTPTILRSNHRLPN